MHAGRHVRLPADQVLAADSTRGAHPGAARPTDVVVAVGGEVLRHVAVEAPGPSPGPGRGAPPRSTRAARGAGRRRPRLFLHRNHRAVPPPQKGPGPGPTCLTCGTVNVMGIRYFAYVTDLDETDPDREVPDEDVLHLDKAWRALRGLTRPERCIAGRD